MDFQGISTKNNTQDSISIWYVACFICSQALERIHRFASRLAQPVLSSVVQKEE